MELLKQGKESEAVSLLYSSNPFPELTSALCDHQRQCRGHCVRGIRGEPVSFPDIEAYISSFPRPYRVAKVVRNKVALVGAGIGNLTIAYLLIQKGYRVDVYEALDNIGGAIYSGIPRFRYSLDPINKIKKELETVGVRFFLNSKVDAKRLVELQKEYPFVVLGVGAPKENMAGLPNVKGIIGGTAFLKSINLIHKEENWKAHYSNPIIWGGGNVAMDCARSVVRIFGKATVVYRRGEEEMPATKVEIEEAKKEGVVFRFLENIVEPIFEEGSLVSVLTSKMAYSEVDDSGRRSVEEIEGTREFLPTDLLIAALGEKSDLSIFELPTLDLEELRKRRIYVVGDARYGAKNIASAIASGKEIASQIEEDDLNSTTVLPSF